MWFHNFIIGEINQNQKERRMLDASIRDQRSDQS